MLQNEQQAANANKRSSRSQLSQKRATKSNAIEILKISLPKRGGALKDIDRNLQVNPTNCTASFFIPSLVSLNCNMIMEYLYFNYGDSSGWASDLFLWYGAEISVKY